MITTERLILRRPGDADAEQIFSSFANDVDVTRFLGWPRHESIRDTLSFLEFSEKEWERWPAGPYLVAARDTGRLVGSSGFTYESAERAMTGYVFAKQAWGMGYATETLNAIVALAPRLGLRRLYALCHPEHTASYRVLEKCGFVRECTLARHTEFPNLKRGERADVLCYARSFA